MSRVGDAQTAHTVCVSPLGKMPLESLGAFVSVVTADFTIVTDI